EMRVGVRVITPRCLEKRALDRGRLSALGQAENAPRRLSLQSGKLAFELLAVARPFGCLAPPRRAAHAASDARRDAARRWRHGATHRTRIGCFRRAGMAG